jgi:ubiquinone/menaquinone biosynthesis C-methylase UbiE
MEIDKEIISYYNTGIESDRLETDIFQLEKERTQDIISRYLDDRPRIILDVGGGAGHYSFWLTKLGHQVHLLDPVSVNIETARKKAEKSKILLNSIQVGEARQLPWPDNKFDMVLLMGPLYHLTKKEDRIDALRESYRVLKKGGLLFAAGISRYSSLFDGFFRNLVKDPDFFQIVEQDITTGQHRNFTEKLAYFTTAYFHQPDELVSEINESGFSCNKIFAVESFGWLIPEFIKKWAEKDYRPLLLEMIRSVEENRELLGLSAHFLTVGEK